METIKNNLSDPNAFDLSSNEKPNHQIFKPRRVSLTLLQKKYPKLFAFIENSMEKFKFEMEEKLTETDCLLLKKHIRINAKTIITSSADFQSQNSRVFSVGVELIKTVSSNDLWEFTQNIKGIDSEWKKPLTKISILNQMNIIDSLYKNNFFWFKDCEGLTAILMLEGNDCKSLKNLELKTETFYNMFWYPFKVLPLAQGPAFQFLQKFKDSDNNIHSYIFQSFFHSAVSRISYLTDFLFLMQLSLKIRKIGTKYVFEGYEKNHFPSWGMFMEPVSPFTNNAQDIIEAITTLTGIQINGETEEDSFFCYNDVCKKFFSKSYSGTDIFWKHYVPSTYLTLNKN